MWKMILASILSLTVVAGCSLLAPCAPLVPDELLLSAVYFTGSDAPLGYGLYVFRDGATRFEPSGSRARCGRISDQELGSLCALIEVASLSEFDASPGFGLHNEQVQLVFKEGRVGIALEDTDIPDVYRDILSSLDASFAKSFPKVYDISIRTNP